MGTHFKQRAVRTSYDAVANEYAARIDGELAYKPFDRELLDSFASQVREHGPVADVGCGPGMVTQYLHDAGASAFGIDLSPRMVERARELHPDVSFKCEDFTRLEVPDDHWAGIVAFYSLIHVPRDEVQVVLRDFLRVLTPGGLLLLGFHIGSETRHTADWWEQAVDLDFVFFQMSEMLSYLWGAGFDTELHIEREPYPEIELQTQRGYVLARKPVPALVHEG